MCKYLQCFYILYNASNKFLILLMKFKNTMQQYILHSQENSDFNKIFTWSIFHKYNVIQSKIYLINTFFFFSHDKTFKNKLYIIILIMIKVTEYILKFLFWWSWSMEIYMYKWIGNSVPGSHVTTFCKRRRYTGMLYIITPAVIKMVSIIWSMPLLNFK